MCLSLETPYIIDPRLIGRRKTRRKEKGLLGCLRSRSYNLAQDQSKLRSNPDPHNSKPIFPGRKHPHFNKSTTSPTFSSPFPATWVILSVPSRKCFGYQSTQTPSIMSWLKMMAAASVILHVSQYLVPYMMQVRSLWTCQVLLRRHVGCCPAPGAKTRLVNHTSGPDSNHMTRRTVTVGGGLPAVSEPVTSLNLCIQLCRYHKG